VVPFPASDEAFQLRGKHWVSVIFCLPAIGYHLSANRDSGEILCGAFQG
jgi:hypothetical protein